MMLMLALTMMMMAGEVTDGYIIRMLYINDNDNSDNNEAMPKTMNLIAAFLT